MIAYPSEKARLFEKLKKALVTRAFLHFLSYELLSPFYPKRYTLVLAIELTHRFAKTIGHESCYRFGGVFGDFFQEVKL